MKRRWKLLIAATTLILAAVAGTYFAKRAGLFNIETIEKEDVKPSQPDDLLEDDRLEDKDPQFDPALIDSRLFGADDNPWQVNASAAVIRLDVLDIRSDGHESLQRLYPDYASATRALNEAGFDVLPSVNVIGGKAKQFDDGLYAALDLYMAQNHERGVRDVELCVRQILTELNPMYEPYAWLWASLEVGGFVTPDEYSRRPKQADEFVNRFLGTPASQPVGFYAWSENLQRTFRFLRYLQQPFVAADGTAGALARALDKNSAGKEQYLRMLKFYSNLTNPFQGLALTDLEQGKLLKELATELGRERATAHFLPYSTSQENALFERLYANGAPPDANLMRDLIQGIRDRDVDLSPRENSGWYDYQVHALETLVLPEIAPENNKLLLTKKYKLRLLEAFKSMITKTRETHIRQMAVGADAAVAPPENALSPRLRVEPNPTYFLRMARSYSFLQTFLVGSVENLNAMVGHTRDGLRDMPLGDELESMRMLLYGLYFVSCEDIGLQPTTLENELGYEPVYVKALALKWLEDWQTDPDLAADTRVGVPIFNSVATGITRFWCTLGVRPIKLTARYETQPSWRPKPVQDAEPEEWRKVPHYQLEQAQWVILGDEFAEIQLKGTPTITRKELRDICDAHKTKSEIIKAFE